MQISTARRTSFLLALLIVSSTAVSAPAPIYKERPSLESAHRALPERLRYAIESFEQNLPDIIAVTERNMRLARTQREKDISLSTIACWKAEFYRYPIELLESHRKHPRNPSREHLKKIEEALKFYRIRYHEAKRKGLLVEPPGMRPLK